MNTHEAAKLLEDLARVLRKVPDVPIRNLRTSDMQLQPDHRAGALALNLGTLASLSRVDRKQWLELIREHAFPIEVRPRDASRDVLGKLLRYLEGNPGAIRQLQQRAKETGSTASPELLKALQTLLQEP